MKKSLGFWRSWALVVGTMIGSGVFLLPTVLAPYGSLSLAGWILAGAGTLFIALTLGILARRLPRIGGPYAYARAAFGDLPAFLIAWGYWISLWASVASVAVAFSGYLNVFIPAFTNDTVANAASSIVVIWLFVGINIAGIRTAGIVQLITTLLKLLPLLVIAGAGLMVGNVADVPAVIPEGESLPLVIAGLVMLTMWAYVGVEAATVPAEDVIDPERTIPRSLVWGTLTATVVYILATLGVMALVPTSELAESSSPFSEAAYSLFGTWGARFIGIGALISIVGALNSLMLLSAQISRAAALDGLFPARFERLNDRRAPAFGLLISGSLSTILIFLNYTRGLVAAFTALILLSTLMTLLPYGASAAAELALQRSEKRVGKPVSTYAKVVALLALVFSITTIIGSGWETILYGLILIAVGFPVYFWVKRNQTLVEGETVTRSDG